MPQIVLKPYMARTMIEYGCCVKVRARYRRATAAGQDEASCGHRAIDRDGSPRVIQLTLV